MGIAVAVADVAGVEVAAAGAAAGTRHIQVGLGPSTMAVVGRIAYRA